MQSFELKNVPLIYRNTSLFLECNSKSRVVAIIELPNALFDIEIKWIHFKSFKPKD